MLKHLLLLLVFTGIVPFILPIPHRYYLIQEMKTWNDAQVYCQGTYSDLATISSNDDMVKFQDEVQTQQFSSGVWVGLYTNIDSWHWSFGNKPLGSFISWSNSEPNNMVADEQCGVIANYLWYDAPCAWPFSFVCFDDTRAGADSYIFISEGKKWYDAQSYCRQHYTDLAMARDATENSMVGEKNIDQFTWFGLIRDPWKWSDQNPDVSFIHWSPGNSDDYTMNKSCGYFSTDVADCAQCSDEMAFICYLYPNQVQIIRVKIKSSRDVNDPAVMVAILEKIKQKAVEHGVAVITVKWRKQRDGVVFHKQKENNTAVNNPGGSCEL